MTLKLKLIVIILFVALVPLTVSAVSALAVHQAAFDAEVSQGQQKTATFSAQAGDAYLEHLRSSFELLASHSIDWTSLSQEEREAALWIAYRTSEDVAAVVLLDANSNPKSRGAYTELPNDADATAGHPAIQPRGYDALLGQAKRLRTEGGPSKFSAPFRIPGYPNPFVSLRVSISQAGDSLLVAFSLRRFCDKLVGGSPLDLVLFDPSGILVCHNALNAPPDIRGLRKLFSGTLATGRYDVGGHEFLAAAALTALRWTMVAQQPTEQAFRSSRNIRNQTLFWIATSLLIAVGAGSFLARGITRPMALLMEGTEALAKGQLSHRIRLQEKDEFGALANAFDHMSGEIAARDAEIRKYNEELQARVLERTSDLIRAHEQLLQSQRVAAVGALGAGLAEEVNDALTGVLGVSQLLLMRARRDKTREKEVELLESAEKEALHIRDVISKLQRLTKGQGLTNLSDVAPNDLLDATLSLVKRDPSTSMIRFLPEYGRDLPKIRGNFMQLQRGILQILTNAIEACGAEDGRVILRTRLSEEGNVELSISDNGHGIDGKDVDRVFDPFFTTHKEREGRGLGLAIAARIIEDHRARISLESEVDEGTTVTIAFPSRAPAEAVA